MNRVTVNTARELDDLTKEKIISDIKSKEGFDSDINFVINKSLIGGIVIQKDDTIFDGSVLGQINKIRHYLSRQTNFTDIRNIAKDLSLKVEEFNKEIDTHVVGVVRQCNDDVIFAEGLADVRYGELLKIKNSYAMVLNLEQSIVGAVVLNNPEDIFSGDTVFGTGRVIDVGVSEEILGRVINPLGKPVDNKGRFKIDAFRRLEVDAPAIKIRDSVNEPLSTGIIAIDSMIPIGKGQRELIIGDRQTGKTAIAIDTIINQKGKNVICVYVAIGQKASTIAKMIQTLEENKAMDYCVVVSSSADDSASMQYLAPYTGCAVAEYFMYQGRDVLIVYDDLTKHAIAYRTITLLLKRPSGREAFPGDIFYTHSRLLERAAKLNRENGGGSMTALPIIETQMGDISAYIPTNVISITDGQIFLETELFNAGIRPAVNVGLSVSRVGGAAQYKAVKKVSGKLRLDLANYRELAVFSQFVSELDPETNRILKKGELLTEGLKQNQYEPMDFEKQTVFLYVLINNLFEDLTPSKLNGAMKDFLCYIKERHSYVFEEIRQTKDLSPKIMDNIKSIAEEFKSL